MGKVWDISIASELDKKLKQVLVAMLLNAAGLEEAHEIHEPFTFGADEGEDDYKMIKQSLENTAA